MSKIAELSDALLAVTHDDELARLSLRQIALLMFLRANEGQMVWGTQELSRAMGFGKPAVTRATSILVGLGLSRNSKRLVPGQGGVMRVSDGRLNSITLTPKGEAAADRLAAGFQAKFSKAA